MAWSGGRAQDLPDEFRRKISTIGPNDCAGIRIEAKLLEPFWIAQWLKHFAFQFLRQVDLSLDAIVESHPDRISAGMFKFHNFRDQVITPTDRFSANASPQL